MLFASACRRCLYIVACSKRVSMEEAHRCHRFAVYGTYGEFSAAGRNEAKGFYDRVSDHVVFQSFSQHCGAGFALAPDRVIKYVVGHNVFPNNIRAIAMKLPPAQAQEGLLVHACLHAAGGTSDSIPLFYHRVCSFVAARILRGCIRRRFMAGIPRCNCVQELFVAVVVA